MLSKKIKVFLLFFCLQLAIPFINAEHISLKFSYKTNSLKIGDVNTWIESFNTLWQDWQSRHGGQLSGGFTPLSYGSNLDFEMRVPIYAGLGLDLGGGRHTSSGEGTITFQNAAGNQTETQFISNQATAYPFKIGFSYYFAIPSFERLSLFAGFGRQIIFVQYNTQDKYTATMMSNGTEFSYWYNKDNKYGSEALGTYISFGLEFEIIQYIAVVLEAEKTWSKIDGFKSNHIYEGYLGENIFKKGGKASLYFYESDQWNLGQHYSVLTSHKERPDETYMQNIRQGEFDFSNFSFKIGLRLKF
jgi:hypothetical protein